MVSTTEFNLQAGKKAERCLMATYVNVGTREAPLWEIMGAGVEESSVELNPDIATVTDVLGITETTVNKLEEKQSFEPNTLRAGQKLNARLLDIAIRRDMAAFAQFEVMRAYKIYGTDAAIRAHIDVNCTIIPQSVGGSSYLDMPLEVTFSGNRTHGTVQDLKNPTFTPEPTA